MNWRRLFRRQPKPVKIAPHWEAVADPPHKDDATQGVFYRVRWSEEGKGGGWLYVRHYGGNGTSINKHMATRSAEEMNRDGRHPAEWSCWLPVEPPPPLSLREKIEQGICWVIALILFAAIWAIMFYLAAM